MSEERFLITGGLGCIGAWAARDLVLAGAATAIFDLSEDRHRLRHIMSDKEISRIRLIQGDITDLITIRQALLETGASHVIHLAGLQIPHCRANPALGARVNVVGTANVFEAVRRARDQVRGLAYASSVAVLGPDQLYPQKPVPDDVTPYPNTLYGVYKQANEQTARLYWQDWEVSSVGLRPYIVYGVGRDQGLTSDLTRAILAAAAGRPFQVRFSGRAALQYAADVAQMFIQAVRAGHSGAAVCNLRNDVLDVADFVTALVTEVPEAKITVAPDQPLPFPADLDDSGLRRILGQVAHTPLKQAIRDSLSRFKQLIAEDRIDLNQLEA
jgi:nucleoside-diphosphate-sugar epimerase